MCWLSHAGILSKLARRAPLIDRGFSFLHYDGEKVEKSAIENSIKHTKPQEIISRVIMKPSTANLVLLGTSLLSCFSQVDASCPSIITTSNSCSSSVFSGSSSIVTSCSEDGSSITVSGTVTAASDFDAAAEITALPCVSGMYCHEKYAQNLGMMCDLVTNDAGEACGTAGTYTVNEVTYPIPDTKSVKSMMGMATIRLLLSYDAECSGAKTSFPWLYGMSVVPLVGVAWYLRQRQRRRPLLVLEDGASNFVEMKDVQRLGSMV